jgi:hypothetical protein
MKIEISKEDRAQAIADAQQRMEQRIGDLNGELYFPEFQYWSREERKHRKK